MSVSLYRVLGDVMGTAHALARKHKLERDGTIWCWNCSEKPALMPSLHCHVCLTAAHRRKGREMPVCLNRKQTPEDVEACK